MLCDSEVHNKVCTVSCKYFVTDHSDVQHLFFISLQILSVLLCTGNLACHWLIMRRKELLYFKYV